MNLNADELDIYKAEWSHCEARIGRYDSLVFQVRGWATSASGALLAVAFTLAKQDLVFVGGFIAVMFWMIEAINKIYQGVFIDRSHDIQKMLAAHMNNSVTQSMKDELLIGQRFDKKFADHPFDDIREIIGCALYSNVATFYVALVLACAGSYFIISRTHLPLRCAVATSGCEPASTPLHADVRKGR